MKHRAPVYRTVHNNSRLHYLLFFLTYKYINATIKAIIVRPKTSDNASAAFSPLDPEIKNLNAESIVTQKPVEYVPTIMYAVYVI